MTDKEVKGFTNNIFELIKKAKTIEDLENITEKDEKLSKNSIKIDSYPKIEFSINENEIKSLLDNKVLEENLSFTRDITSKLNDPLTKLLFATLWKNGDLKKIKHIIKGILDVDNEKNDQEEALVFYQFGKYLTKTPGQPIIDQHVLRAFGVYRLTELEQLITIRQINTIKRNHKDLIKQYKDWLNSDELTNELKLVKDYTYHIDKLLFATGKTIKKLD